MKEKLKTKNKKKWKNPGTSTTKFNKLPSYKIDENMIFLFGNLCTRVSPDLTLFQPVNISKTGHCSFTSVLRVSGEITAEPWTWKWKLWIGVLCVGVVYVVTEGAWGMVRNRDR